MSETIDRYLTTVARVLSDTPRSALDAIVDALDAAHTIFVCGNGGSAATAAHFACDLAKIGRRAIALSTNDATLTMLANDTEYANVFRAQLDLLAEPGDAIVLLSVSGESPNVRSLPKWANAHGCVTIALGSALRGTTLALATHRIEVPTVEYGPVEDVHQILCHALTKALEERR